MVRIVQKIKVFHMNLIATKMIQLLRCLGCAVFKGGLSVHHRDDACKGNWFCINIIIFKAILFSLFNHLVHVFNFIEEGVEALQMLVIPLHQDAVFLD